MTNHGDDCYFYYYSTCTKGDSCPFRHCEAARGNETVCNLWQEGRCFRMVCKFRHMEIQKNRKEIACYWENQPAGCQKTHCVFYHEKQRRIDGILVPPSRGPKAEEPQHEEPAPPPTPLPAASNPQLRGVLKAEAQETVPSPTHPPVVINPADDDEDEDDQFSEEGEDGKYCPDGNRLTSPRKLSGASSQILNFGVSTLEEIRLRKALKASMKRAGYPVQSPDGAQLKSHRANRENHHFHDHPVGFQAREDPAYCGETKRNNISDRLGKTMSNKDGVLEQPPRKRSLADRLGRVVEDEEHLRNGLKPIRERLGFQADAEAPVWPVKEPESVLVPSEAPQQIRIKTLEEIRQEKASKAQNKRERLPASALGSTAAKSTSSRSPRLARSVTVKERSPAQTKTVSAVHANKNPEADQPKPDRAPSPGRASPASERPSAKARGPPSPPGADLRVKTLEEIRQEKAARLQAQQARAAGDPKGPRAAGDPRGPRAAGDTRGPVADAGEDPTKKPGLPCLNKAQVPTAVEPSTPSHGTQTKKNPEAKEKPVSSSAEVNTASRNGVKVKTFEEIMREKRLRKQELEEPAPSSASPSPGSADTEPPRTRSPDPAAKKTLPIQSHDAPAAKAAPPSAGKPSEGLSTAQSPPVRKRIALKPKAVSPSVPSPSSAAPTPPPQPSLTDAGPQGPHPVSHSCSTLTHAKQTKRMASQHKTPGQSAEIKVRPKLNVKPSVMKHAAQVKPGHKRKLAVRSAVAEVKPLNSAPTGAEEQLQEPQCKQRALSPTKAGSQPSPAAPQGPASRSAQEELQTVPIFTHTPLQGPPTSATRADEAAGAAAMETSVPQSPVMKTLTPVRPRRPSFVASRVSNVSSSSAVDDFDELMNEFTDDHLGEDMDPGMGEDDLLQELSEMIDS